jgi:hypothetical protein
MSEPPAPATRTLTGARSGRGESPDRGGRLRAFCLGCGLERTDQPLISDERLSICLVCGDTRVVFDLAPDREPPRAQQRLPTSRESG